MNTQRRNTIQRIVLTLGLALSATAMAAYPEKPVRIIVPFPAGGPSDTAARAISQSIANELKQPVIVDNQPGASGAIAAQTVLRAPADGYTLLWVSASMGVLPYIQNKPAFKSLNDFTSVSSVASFTFGLFVHPSVPAKSVAELVAYAKANPGKLAYATGAPSEHVTAAQFIHQTQLDMLRIPYKGGVQAMPDLLAGRVQVFFTPLSLGLQHVKTGKLRLLATVTSKRNALTPSVPTLEEAGIKGVSVPSWQALMAPPNTPEPIAAQIAKAVAKAAEQPALRSQYAEQGTVVDVRSGKDFAQAIARDAELWKRFVAENDIPKE